MIAFSIGLDRKLSTWVAQVKQGLTPMIAASVRDTTAYGKGLIIRSTAKGRTGLTQGGWNSAPTSSLTWKIWNRFKHALFLETGTGIFGPKKRRLLASELTKNGKFFAWPVMNKNTKEGYAFAQSTDGMEAQPAIKPNVPRIQKDLNIRIRNGIRRLYKSVRAK